jgi:hypothetical protein
MTEQKYQHPDHGRPDRNPHKRLGTFVDVPAAPSYHLHMPFRADPDLADRRDPERQGPDSHFRRQDADFPQASRARLSNPRQQYR